MAASSYHDPVVTPIPITPPTGFFPLWAYLLDNPSPVFPDDANAAVQTDHADQVMASLQALPVAWSSSFFFVFFFFLLLPLFTTHARISTDTTLA